MSFDIWILSYGSLLPSPPKSLYNNHMSSSFTWLALLQPTLSIFIGLIFLVTAFLCLSFIRPHRKAAPVLQTIGFLLLAIPYTLAFTGFFSPFITSTVIFVAALLIVSGFIISRLRVTAVVVAKPEAAVKAKVASVMQTTTSSLPTKSVSSTKPSSSSSPGPVTPAKTIPASVSRTAISAKSGLRSEPLIKLPALKRKRARQFVNVLVGFFVFFLIGWGSYVIAKRVIQPPAPLGTPPSTEDESVTSEPSLTSESPAVPVAASPSIEPTTSPSPSPSEEPARDTVTIKETETGFLNVREGASTATPIITTIDPGSTYPLLDTSTNGDWYKVELDDGKAGWISTKYADKKSAE